jgi:hypothetical protein
MDSLVSNGRTIVNSSKLMLIETFQNDSFSKTSFYISCFGEISSIKKRLLWRQIQKVCSFMMTMTCQRRMLKIRNSRSILKIIIARLMTKCAEVEAFCYFKIVIFDLLHHAFFGQVSFI